MISFAEICKAQSGARAALADGVLNRAYNELYKTNPNPCSPSTPTALSCLFLYLYALDTWEDGQPNFLDETQLAGILVLIEQLSKSCCCDD